MTSELNPTVAISDASIKDAEAILALQKLAYRSEAELYNDWTITPLIQSLTSWLDEFPGSVVLKATLDGRLVGSVRARQEGDTCLIGRLIVHPDMRRQGIGSNLLRQIEARFPNVSRFELFTGNRSEANIRLYERHGYVITRTQAVSTALSMTFMEKRVRREP
jgi:ribosomal protein S18 acetylase RimI-like enzyme